MIGALPGITGSVVNEMAVTIYSIIVIIIIIMIKIIIIIIILWIIIIVYLNTHI